MCHLLQLGKIAFNIKIIVQQTIKFTRKTENDRFRMGKENIPQLTGKIYDLNLNFLPMQMKVHSESRRHHGLFMIIGICRCLASGEPL